MITSANPPSSENMHPYAAFLWDTVTLEFMVKFFLFYSIFFWLVCIIWTGNDIASRTENIWYRIVSVLLIIVGTPLFVPLYLLIRPRKKLFEALNGEIEYNLDILQEMMETHLKHTNINHFFCPHCEAEVEAEFIICPYCNEKLKHSCSHCQKVVRENWSICPYCQTPQETKQSTEAHKQKETPILDQGNPLSETNTEEGTKKEND